MFERFTVPARRIVVHAQREAREFGHDYMGTEHLLLGLLAETEEVGARALAALGIDAGAVRQRVEGAVGPGWAAPGGRLLVTPESKKVIELAAQEAKRLKHKHVDTEHVLLALIDEGEGLASQVLTSMGADADSVRQQVRLLRK